MEGGDSEFENFTLPTLRGFLEARSQNVSGNKQQLVARAIGCPEIVKNNAKTLFSPTLHPLSPVIFATATVVAFVLLRNSRFNFHCYPQRETTPTQKLDR